MLKKYEKRSNLCALVAALCAGCWLLWCLLPCHDALWVLILVGFLLKGFVHNHNMHWGVITFGVIQLMIGLCVVVITGFLTHGITHIAH